MSPACPIQCASSAIKLHRVFDRVRAPGPPRASCRLCHTPSAAVPATVPTIIRALRASITPPPEGPHSGRWHEAPLPDQQVAQGGIPYGHPQPRHLREGTLPRVLYAFPEGPGCLHAAGPPLGPPWVLLIREGAAWAGPLPPAHTFVLSHSKASWLSAKSRPSRPIVLSGYRFFTHA